MFYIGYIRAREDEELQNYINMHVKKCLDKDLNEWFPAYRDFVKAAHTRYNPSLKPSESISSIKPPQKQPLAKSSLLSKEEGKYSGKKIVKSLRCFGKDKEEDSEEIEKDQICHCEGKWKSLYREFDGRMGAIERKLEMVLQKLDK